MKNFSIIIPIYNNEIIWETLHTISFLEYPKSAFELIIIDDGSDVKYKLKTQYFISKYKGIFQIKYFFIWDKNWKMRVNLARNKWVKESKYEQLIFIDGDSLLPPYILKNYNDFLKHKDEKNIIVGESIWYNYLKVEPIKTSFILKWDFEKYLRNPKYRDFRRLWYYKEFWHVFLGGNFSISKKQFYDIWFWDENILSWWEDDIEYAFRAVKKEYTFFLIKRIEIYNVNDWERMSRERFFSTLKNQCYILKKYNFDQEYLDYIKQRFENTDIEIKQGNIPTIFQKTIMKNSYFNSYFSFKNYIVRYFLYDKEEITNKYIISKLINNGICINFIVKTSDIWNSKYILELQKKYPFMITIQSLEYVNSYRYNWIWSEIKSYNELLKFKDDETQWLWFINLSNNKIDDKLIDLLIHFLKNKSHTCHSYDIINSYLLK